MICAMHVRSIVMNQYAAASTVLPTVKRPWFWWMAAFPFGNFDAISRPAAGSSTTAPPCSAMTTWSS